MCYLNKNNNSNNNNNNNDDDDKKTKNNTLTNNSTLFCLVPTLWSLLNCFEPFKPFKASSL